MPGLTTDICCAGGKLVTDVTNASRTSLMDLQSQQWHEPTLELFGVPKALLASIHSSAEELGWIKGGPLDGVPITGAWPSLLA